MTQATADGRYLMLSKTTLQTVAGWISSKGLQSGIGGLVTSGSVGSALGFTSDNLKGAGNRMLYADAGGHIHAGSSYPPATGGTGGMTQAQADGRYLKLSGGTVTGKVNLHGGVDVTGTFLAHGGWHFTGKASGTLNMNSHSIYNVPNPTSGTMATNKNYVDSKVSDKRLKKDIVALDYGLDDLMKLEAVTFNYTHELHAKGRNNSRHHGFIAQEVAQVMPDLVYDDPIDLDDDGNSVSGENIKGFDKTDLVPTLVNAVKELKAEIDQLKRDLANARSS